jgi:hypothetical protein
MKTLQGATLLDKFQAHYEAPGFYDTYGYIVAYDMFGWLFLVFESPVRSMVIVPPTDIKNTSDLWYQYRELEEKYSIKKEAVQAAR